MKNENGEEIEDCPEQLVTLFDASKSEWRKAVIKEFISLHDWKTKVSNRLARIERYEKVIIVVLVAIAGMVAKGIFPEIIKALTELI